MDSIITATDPFAPPFFDFLLGFPSASTCRKRHLSPWTQPFSRLVVLTHGMRQYWHGGSLQSVYRHGILLLSSTELSSLLPYPCENCCPLPSVCFALEWDAGEDDRPFCLWPFLLFFPQACGSWLKLHESPLEHCPCDFHWKHSPIFLATKAFLSFLTFGNWSVWSWQEFCDFDLYYPSRIASESISLTDNCAWSHRTSKSWTLSFCKVMVTKSASPCTASDAPVERTYSSSMYAICLPRKNRSVFWARCSSTLTLFRKVDCVLISFLEADAIIASSTSKSRKSFFIIDRDVLCSSIDLAISISLIQSMVTWGSAVRTQTSIPKFDFQLWNSRVRKISMIPFRN